MQHTTIWIHSTCMAVHVLLNEVLPQNERANNSF